MSLRRSRHLLQALCAGAAALTATADAADVAAASAAAPAASSLPARAKLPADAEQGPTWASLKPAQRNALKPLERDWSGIDGLRKRKWLEIAERYPSMSPEDQTRLQTRMAEWAKLTPLERGQVRLNYQEAKQAPVQNRQASWEAYQALPPEQRRELADRASPASASASRSAQGSAQTGAAAVQTARPASEGPQVKSNTVPNPALAAPPKPIAPTVVQAQPGVTTRLISQPPAPPAHQPKGMPKIAATPQFVDEKTLLPQTGAQSAAAARAPAAPAASAPSTRP